MNLTPHTVESAPAPSRSTLEGIAQDLGVVPNLAATLAESPSALAAFDALRRAVASADLDPLLREVAGLAVGVAVDNAYGVAFHSTVLTGMGMSDDDIATMRAGQPPTDPLPAAVYDLAQEIVNERGKVNPAAIARVSAHGIPDAQILDVVTECTFAGLVGVVDNLVGRVELDPFLADRAWTKVTA
jgi:alkylhydroperoxidase family enzyme